MILYAPFPKAGHATSTPHNPTRSHTSTNYLSACQSPLSMAGQSPPVVRFNEHVFHGVHDLEVLLNTPPTESTDLLVYLAAVGMTDPLDSRIEPKNPVYRNYLRDREHSHRCKIDRNAKKYERSLSHALPSRYPESFRTIQDLRHYVEPRRGCPIYRIGERKWAYFNATLVASGIPPIYYSPESPLGRHRQVALMQEMRSRIA